MSAQGNPGVGAFPLHLAWPSWFTGLRADYQRVFVDEWSPYLGGILLAVVAAVLMLSGLFWGVFGGLTLWGDYLNQWLGLGPALGIRANLDHPLMHRISLLDVTLLMGALAAALMAGQFRINRPPPIEYLWGALGGLLMGLGAVLAGGCTVGGFFTPAMFSSGSGWAMWAGLLAGAWIGLKLLLLVTDRVTIGTTPPRARQWPALRAWRPLAGIVLAVIALAWAAQWFVSDDKRLAARGIVVLAGFGLGFILHRSRFCVARAFREPFMTGEGTMTKAVILSLAIGIPLGSLLLQKKTVDPYIAIPASFWLGALAGGVVFGIGMTFAGGCATGSMWRAAEGHVKLMVALLFFAWGGSTLGALGRKTGLLASRVDVDFLDGVAEITPLGYQAYLPDLLGGWGAVYALGLGVLAVWYLLVRYNETSERFTVF